MKTSGAFIVGLVASVLLLQSCAQSPTGRTKLAFYSSNEMAELGATSFEEMKSELKISKNQKLTNFVQCVADNILPNVDENAHDGDWEVVLFESELVNAFALPGGKIGVYTGILNVTENQHQLAAIMGHEIAHVIAEHSNERMSSNKLAEGGLTLTQLLLSDKDDSTKELAEFTYNVSTQLLILMPYGRSHEKEADIIGQELMAKSGFDPKAAIELWKNMAKLGTAVQPEFLSTHPSNDTRIEKLTKHLTATQPMYDASQQKPKCRKY